MEFLIKRTIDLTEQEVIAICELFEEVFEGNTKGLQCFYDEFKNTALGYSLHALMVDNDQIVGSHTLIPCHYLVNGNSVLMAFSVDTMIKKGYRDFFNLKDLIDLSEIEALKYKIKFIFGFPNDHSYPVLKKGLQYKDIGKMHTYIYPYRIGGIKPKMRCFNGLSIFCCRSLDFFSRLFTNKTVSTSLLDKDREKYNTYRYQWFDQNYKQVQLDDFYFVYKIKNHEGIRTAFLLDIDKVSGYNISRAISYIRKNESENFDLLMYVGLLPNSCLPLFKVPHRFEPKNFNFIGKFLDKENKNNEWFNIQNWNVNLSCYDLI